FGITNSSLAGFTFTSGVMGAGNTWFHIQGNGGWRVHDNKFVNTNAASNNECFVVHWGSSGPPLGVFDHNSLHNCRFYIQGDVSSSFGGTAWAQPTAWGANNAVYIENNTFDDDRAQGNCLDGQYGARIVARFNTITGCPFEFHGAQ